MSSATMAALIVATIILLYGTMNDIIYAVHPSEIAPEQEQAPGG